MSRVEAILYASSAMLFTAGISFSAVPIYKLFCSATGFGGTAKAKSFIEAIQESNLKIMPPIKVKFISDIQKSVPWDFSPELRHIYVRPGETALTFFKAKSYSDNDTTGMATYNIFPPKAAQYFNKIQCFCFEKQKLGPGEGVDMPVFFYIDKEFAFDGEMRDVKEIILSYTFFPSSD